MLLSTAAVAASLLAAGPAFAHGDEGQALAEVPARTLVQQALGLLTQTEEPAEAMERLEAALDSQDTEGVDLASVRDALRALERGDHEEAIAHLNEALAPAEEPAQPTGEPAGGHEEGPAPAKQAPQPSEEALSHTEEFEPDRGTAEWVGVAVGVFLIAVALGLLATRRRATAA